MEENNNSYGIIYKAINLINGKVYIGQTTRDLGIRISRHLYDAKIENKTIFQRALNKYGKDSFHWEIIDKSDNQEDLDIKEVYWIRHYNSFYGNKDSNGYNMTIGGYGASGENHPSFNKEVTEDTKIKISKSLKGKYVGENSKLSKPVIQLSLDGKFLNRYSSTTEATNIVGSHIASACNGKTKSAHGFLWIYEDEYNDDKVNKKIESYNNGRKAVNRVRIVQLDMDGNLIKIHDSATEAISSVANHKSPSNIFKCCKGKLRHAYGFIWLYEKYYIEKE